MNHSHVGTWSVLGHRHQFVYTDEWLDNAAAIPISLSMPLTQGPHPFVGHVVFDFFDNLLPDTADIRRRLARQVHARSDGTFDLISEIGRDCVGALMLLPTGEIPSAETKPSGTTLSEADIESLLNRTLDGAAFAQVEDGVEFRISLAGAQHKTALLHWNGNWMLPTSATPTTHILKLPIGSLGAKYHFHDSVENEWLCAQIAKEYGLTVAHSEIARFGQRKVLVVERFDREQTSTGIRRLPQEDYCQVFGLSSAQKYDSDQQGRKCGIAEILDHLRGSTYAEEDRAHFIVSQLVFWILCAPDGHAKNFSVSLLPGGAFELTPLYDILSAWPLVKNQGMQYQDVSMAMGLKAKNKHFKMQSIMRRHWNIVARKSNIADGMDNIITEFIEMTPQVISNVRSRLPNDFPKEVSESIFEGMLQHVNRLAKQPAW
jgi:serine/threonine-protein kinase HipA